MKYNKKAIIYTRVSTDEQAQFGYSLAAQEESLRNWSEAKNIEVIQHFQDDHSAKTFNRPEFIRLLTYAKKNRSEIDMLLFTQYDRFSRNLKAGLLMIEQVRKLRIELQAINQIIDWGSPDHLVMLSLYLSIPEVDNTKRANATREGMRRAMSEGRWITRPPKGYRREWLDAKNKLIVPDEISGLIAEAFERIASGSVTQEEVRLWLRKQGVPIGKNTISTMLRNPVYEGKIRIKATDHHPEITVPGLHEPLVSEDVFQRVQHVLDGRKGPRTNIPTTLQPEFPLRGLLQCPECGSNLTGSFSRGRAGGRYPYYHCQRGCRVRFKSELVNEKFKLILNSITIPRPLCALYLEILEDVFEQKEGRRDDQLRHAKKKVVQAEERLLKLDQKFVMDQVSRSSYDRLLPKYEHDLALAESAYQDLIEEETSFIRYMKDGVCLLTHLPKMYADSSVEIKQKIVGSIFEGKLVFDGEHYRTAKPSEGISLILSDREPIMAQKKRTERGVISSRSSKVALQGLEP